MKTLMLMATTVNGYIARRDGNSDFVAADSWKDDLKKVKDIGCLIMGYGTYDYLVKQQDFPLQAYNVVMTKKKLKSRWKNVMFTGKRPKEILSLLEQKGFKKVMLYGGAKANSSFLREKLVDEFYLYLVPASFGDGIELFERMNLEVKLKLLKIDKFSQGVIGLHYKVVKAAKRVKIHN